MEIWHAAPDGSATCIARVLDAKWKRLDPESVQWGVDQSDIYQLLAYALRYGCQRVELIYPVPGAAHLWSTPAPVFMIHPNGIDQAAIEVRIKTAPLWA